MEDKQQIKIRRLIQYKNGNKGLPIDSFIDIYGESEIRFQLLDLVQQDVFKQSDILFEENNACWFSLSGLRKVLGIINTDYAKQLLSNIEIAFNTTSIPMRIKCLDKQILQNNQYWYLCKANLLEYIKTLNLNFSDFRIQRRIVKNSYLDKLYLTICNKEPMPTITLIAYNFNSEDKQLISGNNFDILDGLQRTYRLWAIWTLYTISKEQGLNQPIEIYKYIKEQEKDTVLIYNSDFITLKLIKKLFEEVEGTRLIDNIIKSYEEYEVYFYIWEGLSETDIVEKMLVLNAGQKSVSSTHQYELLFLHFFEQNRLSYNEQLIHIYREKDVEDFSRVKKGEKRQVGEYCLSSVVIALQSFIQGKPIRVTPANQINNEDIEDDSILAAYFSKEKLSEFISQVQKIDNYYSKESLNFTKWFGKDTTMSGIFAAIGKHHGLLSQCIKEIDDIADIVIKKDIDFMLDDFHKEYDNLASTKINVGQYVRGAIFRYTYAYLQNEEISWHEAFKMINNDEI